MAAPAGGFRFVLFAFQHFDRPVPARQSFVHLFSFDHSTFELEAPVPSTCILRFILASR